MDGFLISTTVFEKSFDPAEVSNTEQDFFWKTDGTRLFVLGASPTKVWQYDVADPWEVDTAVYNGVSYNASRSASAASFGTNNGNSINFSPDGLHFYILGGGSALDIPDEGLWQWDLPVAWDISSVTESLLVMDATKAGVISGAVNCHAMSSDGRFVFVLRTVTLPNTSRMVERFRLPTPFSVAGGSFDGMSFATTAGTTLGIAFNPSGTKFFLQGGSPTGIRSYDLSVAWDISVPVQVDSVDDINVSSSDATIHFGKNGQKLYLLNFTNDQVRQYHIDSPVAAELTYTMETKQAGTGLVTILSTSATVDIKAITITALGDVTVGVDLIRASMGKPLSESIINIPGADGAGQVQNSEDRDEIWTLVTRTINGETKRYIEVFERDYEEDDAAEDNYYADSIITFDGSATDTISSLDHLEGEIVKVLADGAIHPDRTVANGSITLDAQYSVVQIGLGYHHTIKPLKLITGAAVGTPQGKTKQIFGVTFVLQNSHILTFGPDLDNLRTVDFRQVSDLTDQPAALFTGEHFEEWDDDWKTDPRMVIHDDSPTPFTLLALAPETDTSETK